ncbi:MAG: hypothetical protein HOY78_46530, partial [Saccharothrix sp.]|nr:hypothetical protein [Saccharothrix sp.]
WAQSLARSIVVPHLREKALGSVAVAAAATNPERAESIARSLPDGHAKTRVTELIGHTILQRQAEALAAAGDFLLATATLSAVTSPYRRVRMACAIARRAVAAGEAGMAATLLTRASEEVERVGNTDERALSIQDFAHTAAVAGRLDWAKHLVDTIPGVSRRVQALAALARTAVDRGLAADATALFDAAEALAWSIGDPDDQAWALLAVAEHAENCGDRRRVDGIVHRARKALGGNRPAARLARALTTVAHAAAVNGHEDWARRLDDHIRLELADAADHELPAAPETVPRDVVSSVDDLHRSITEPARRAAEWAAMATTALDANQHRIYTAAIEQAIDLSCTLDDPMEEALVLADIVCAAAAADDDRVAGLLDRAEFAAGTVGGVDHRADALAKVAEAAADAGFFDRSEVLARSVTDIRTRARALTHVARCAAQRGDVGWAATTASSIPEAGHRAWALSTVVQATADLGEHEWAEELAGAIEPPATRAATLTAILPRLPDHRRRHVIAEVLDLDEWHQPLPALFAAHPEAIPAVVRELSLSYYGRPELDPLAAQIIA